MLKRTAFVTGASGFLGTNLVRELVVQDWEITVLHRKTSSLRYISDLPLTFKQGSIEILDDVLEAMPDKLDAVFHMAADTSFWSRYNQQQYQTNVIGTQNMVEAALEKKAGRFIYTSSIASYGFHSTNINEDTASNALNSGINYFITKFQAEQAVQKAHKKGLNTVILNPAHIIGPFDTHNWAQVITNVSNNQMPGIPDTWGSFVFAPEVVKAHIAAFHQGQTGHNYILGGVRGSMLEFVNTIEKQLGKPISSKTTPLWLLKIACWYYQAASWFSNKEPILTPEKIKLLAHKVLCNDSKARQALGFQAVPMQQMVSATCRWLEQEKLIA